MLLTIILVLCVGYYFLDKYKNKQNLVPLIYCPLTLFGCLLGFALACIISWFLFIFVPTERYAYEKINLDKITYYEDGFEKESYVVLSGLSNHLIAYYSPKDSFIALTLKDDMWVEFIEQENDESAFLQMYKKKFKNQWLKLLILEIYFGTEKKFIIPRGKIKRLIM